MGGGSVKGKSVETVTVNLIEKLHKRSWKMSTQIENVNSNVNSMSTQMKIFLDILPKSLYDTIDMENLNILRVIHANISDHL